MTEANRNMIVRLATAVVACPVMLAMFYLWPPIFFYGLVVTATAVGGNELFSMTHPEDKIARAIGTATCVGTSLAIYFLGSDPRTWMVIALAAPIVAVVTSLVRLGEISTAALRMTALAFGPIYLASLTLLAVLLRDQPHGAGYVVWTLMIAWFGDTFGYFFGRFLGKHKLYEAVSPKKTIEGALGGLLGSVTGTLLAHFGYLPTLSLVGGIVVALVGGSLGILGDLGESLLKRSTGVKDSGQIVPGHGGILDRIDALLMASTIVFLYTRFVQG